MQAEPYHVNTDHYDTQCKSPNTGMRQYNNNYDIHGFGSIGPPQRCGPVRTAQFITSLEVK